MEVEIDMDKGGNKCISIYFEKDRKLDRKSPYAEFVRAYRENVDAEIRRREHFQMGKYNLSTPYNPVYD
jgi:hypothetical protein